MSNPVDGAQYFVNGRKIDIGAFDTPKHAGMPLGEVQRVGTADFDLDTGDATRVVNNGDALTWWDRQGELQGVPVNVATPLGGTVWRIEPNLSKGQSFSDLKDLFPRIAKAYLIGEAAEPFSWTLAGKAECVLSGTLERAVQQAYADAAASGEEAIVLLSPACASFDQFSDFEARGEAFRAAVNGLSASGGKAAVA